MNTAYRNETCASRGSRLSNLVSGRVVGSGRTRTTAACVGYTAVPTGTRPACADDDAPPERDVALFSPPEPTIAVASLAFSTAALTCARPFLRKSIAAATSMGPPALETRRPANRRAPPARPQMPMTADAERNVNFLTLSAEEAKSRFCEKGKQRRTFQDGRRGDVSVSSRAKRASRRTQHTERK